MTTEIYDYIEASTVEAGDLVFHVGDYIEVSSVVDSGDAIMLKGYSHLTGDNVFYLLTADTEIGLWTE